ncbi:aldose epimerase family protein [Halomonas getboli]|uniref:aldose epimerase family protein n=1 Tax=Halomonas getboli TaxID=2935862 RepID=UPI001FFF0C87|nr:aldose epimerase family protein [Halomonas getboli]MCK2184238.1 galactose mutarotase [Halomonas getboli]
MAHHVGNRGVEAAPFGELPDGREVTLYRLTNADGMTVEVMNYGGIIVSLKAPDREGNVEDIVLGFDTLDGYLSEAYRRLNPYFGALIGRYGNRIDQGRFSLDGTTYQLATNDGDNHLHGGEEGFDRRLWQAEPFSDENGEGVILHYVSEDGEEGYPGRLEATVTYTLTDDNALEVSYRAETDRATPVNLTQHSYFNLSGEGDPSILDHVLTIHGDAFTPVDETLIPTGEIRDVAGTPFDFRQPTPIGRRIGDDNRQLARGGGYDHNFVLAMDNAPLDAPRSAARVVDPDSGRVLEIATTEPGLQFYSGNFLDGSVTGKGGEPYLKRSGFALETQHFPDSPNRPDFPSTILEPDETYRSLTVYRFSTDADDD